MSVRRAHGLALDSVADYRHSPHLAQYPLYDRLAGFVLGTVRSLARAGEPPRVLELGAGHGGYTDLLLAAGCEVTVVEMSRAALARLEARYGRHERLTTHHDPDVLLQDAGTGYALAVCVSVLHHVPDYIALLERLTDRLGAGGALVTLGDPLWYPRVGPVSRAVDRSAYLAWRVGQGRFGEGASAMIRRLRGVYPEARPGEIVYHHVVRDGVDEEAVAGLLSARFADVELVSYWSHHLSALRATAERAGFVNTFAVRAARRSSSA